MTINRYHSNAMRKLNKMWVFPMTSLQARHSSLFLATRTPASGACHARDREAVLLFVAWQFDCRLLNNGYFDMTPHFDHLEAGSSSEGHFVVRMYGFIKFTVTSWHFMHAKVSGPHFWWLLDICLYGWHFALARFHVLAPGVPSVEFPEFNCWILIENMIYRLFLAWPVEIFVGLWESFYKLSTIIMRITFCHVLKMGNFDHKTR